MKTILFPKIETVKPLPGKNQLRQRQELHNHIDEGTRQIRNGEGIILRGEDELRAFFNGIQVDGLHRYEQCNNGRNNTDERG